MKLERIKCKPLERAQNLCVSKSYIVGCTGRKAAIMDKHLNLIHTVEGLEYVYSAEVSPDETKLLLISTGNRFYIVDLRTFEKTRITVKSPYNQNLEGRGCWSFDGRSVWIPVQRIPATAPCAATASGISVSMKIICQINIISMALKE